MKGAFLAPVEASLPIYIYSMPKAGTYFFSAFLSELGLEDTGYHIDRLSYLDTKAHSLEDNARDPTIAKVKGFFVPVMRSLKKNQVAFGHLPLPIHYKILGEEALYVVAYRNPRKTLESEFIDFRFRREDVKWLSKATVESDQDAFEAYLKRHGTTAHMNVFREITLLRSILVSPLCPPVLRSRTIFVNFDEIRADPQAALPLARFTGFKDLDIEVLARLERAMSAETKTKATGLEVDRSALWSAEAERLYAASDFPKILAMAEELGLTF